MKEEELQGKRSFYRDLDKDLSSMDLFNNEEIWRECLIQSMQMSGESRDAFMSLGKLLHELAVAKHFLKNKERVTSLIKSVKDDFKLSDQDIDRITVFVKDFSKSNNEFLNRRRVLNQLLVILYWKKKFQ